MSIEVLLGGADAYTSLAEVASVGSTEGMAPEASPAIPLTYYVTAALSSAAVSASVEWTIHREC